MGTCLAQLKNVFDEGISWPSVVDVKANALL
jgi:hypothetical protein